MAVSDGLAETEKSLWQWARVDAVISATQFQANRLRAYADGYFDNWTCFVSRDIRSTPATPAAPQGEQQIIGTFSQDGGIVTHPAYTVPMIAGDEVLMLHPNISTIPAAWLATILAAIGPVGTNQGLCYYGVVTAVPAGGQFTIPTLAGLGAGKFIDLSGVRPYFAFVYRVAAGGSAPPQNESQPITNYATLTGNFSAGAFTVDVGIGDEVLIIHPFLARIMNLYGLPPREGSVAANWNTGVGTSGEAGEDLLGGASASPAIGAANTRYKLHSLLLDVSALTDGALINVKLFMQIAGVEQKVYDQRLTVPTTAAGETPPPDTNGLWIINGTLVIHDLLRVEVHSNTNENVAIGYTYVLEAM